MKKRFLVVVAALLLPILPYLLFKYPLISVIEIEVRGHNGDEKMRITRNSGLLRLLDDTEVGKEWKKFRFEANGYLGNLRIYYLNANKPDAPARMLYIHNGIVKRYGKNLLGEVVSRKDILNIESTYHGFDGRILFDEDSEPMTTVRGGMTAWEGYYELYP
jgi:hypothetical protein